MALWNRLYAYAKLLAPERLDAEDATSDAFLKDLEKPADPSVSRETREALAFGIVKNKHLKRLRQESTALRHEPEIGREMVDGWSRVGDTEHVAAMRQLRGLQFTAMSELNPYYEQIIQMYFFDCYTIAQIAALVGKRAKQVSNDKRRALEQLREHDELRPFLDDLE
jgi:RNA polymerase sigma factor (sigma-70 family)